MNTRYPRDFGHWTSPWYIGTIESIHERWTLWLRSYQEKSHCDTPGCCELPGTVYGPEVAPSRSLFPSDASPFPRIRLFRWLP